MRLRRNRAVLFVLPDYHSSFALRDALRELGWISEILVSTGYDTRYLYSEDVIRQWEPASTENRLGRLVNIFASLIQYFCLSLRFKYHIHYSRLHFPASFELNLPAPLRKRGVHLAIAAARLIGVVHVHVPAGCRDEASKKIFQKVGGGDVCGNCGYFELCDDTENELYLARARRYAHFSIDSGFYESTDLNVRPVRIKVLDAERWRPNVHTGTERVVVLHSHALESRSKSERNIKGTPVINEVMKRVCERHEHVEYRLVTGLSSRQMLSEQQQAQIVIDQIHYGHWGSSGIEAMGTGAVVVAFLRPEWMANFRRKFPQYSELIPVVSATAETLESVIEQLVTDEKRRQDLSTQSVEFARGFYDPLSVAQDLVKALSNAKW